MGLPADFQDGSLGGYILRNPAELLFVPRDAKRPEHTDMTIEEVQLCFSVLDQRTADYEARDSCRSQTRRDFWAYLGPGVETHVYVKQQSYRGRIESPKTANSVRKAALAAGVLQEIQAWREISFDTSADAWVFPSEKGTTPLNRANLWRRHVGPRLKSVGLDWVDFT
jgi:hypothetical protein